MTVSQSSAQHNKTMVEKQYIYTNKVTQKIKSKERL